MTAYGGKSERARVSPWPFWTFINVQPGSHPGGVVDHDLAHRNLGRDHAGHEHPRPRSRQPLIALIL